MWKPLDWQPYTNVRVTAANMVPGHALIDSIWALRRAAIVFLLESSTVRLIIPQTLISLGLARRI